MGVTVPSVHTTDRHAPPGQTGSPRQRTRGGAYFIDRDATPEAGSDVTLQLSEGYVNLGEMIRNSSDEGFEFPEDPFQSDGEG